MVVTIKIQNPEGQELGSFEAQDYKSIATMAQDNGIEIPVACCRGACYVCACKVKEGADVLQIDKTDVPAIFPATDEQGNLKEIFACVGGVKTEKIKDKNNYEVILEKMI